MAIELETEVAKELVEMKLLSIRTTINQILNDWNYTDIDEFIANAKSGEIEEAEMDGITLRQLQADLQKYEHLLMKIKQLG